MQLSILCKVVRLYQVLGFLGSGFEAQGLRFRGSGWASGWYLCKEL